jgi:hypothetical protein
MKLQLGANSLNAIFCVLNMETAMISVLWNVL